MRTKSADYRAGFAEGRDDAQSQISELCDEINQIESERDELKLRDQHIEATLVLVEDQRDAARKERDALREQLKTYKQGCGSGKTNMHRLWQVRLHRQELLGEGMSQEYWSYDPDDGLQLHDTLEAARNFADAWLERSRDLSDHDGWHEDTEDCSYGRLHVCGKVVINSRRPVNAEEDGEWAAKHFTEMVDYQMQEVMSAQAPEAK